MEPQASQKGVITLFMPAEEEKKISLGELTLSLPLYKSPNDQYNFSFYFGPNTLQALKGVAPYFEQNYYEGVWFFKPFHRYLIKPFFDAAYKTCSPIKAQGGDALLLLLALLLLVIFIKLLLSYFSYRSYILNIKKKAVASQVAQLKEKYKQDPQHAQMKEMQFLRKANLSPFSILGLIGGLVQLPLFFVMRNFLNLNLYFKGVSFLWVSDLASPDMFIKLPFYIPVLGKYISLLALLVAILQVIIPKLDGSSPKIENTAFFYMMPLLIFFMFNGFTSVFCIYRIFTIIVDVLFSGLLSLFVNIPYHQQAAIQAGQKAEKDMHAHTTTMPRNLVRLEKKKKK